MARPAPLAAALAPIPAATAGLPEIAPGASPVPFLRGPTGARTEGRSDRAAVDIRPAAPVVDPDTWGDAAAESVADLVAATAAAAAKPRQSRSTR